MGYTVGDYINECKEEEQGYYAATWWQWNDIAEKRQELELPEWSEKRCRDFLRKIENNLQDEMVRFGWEMIEGELTE